MQVVADTAVAAACIALKEEEPCEVAVAAADTSSGREAEVFVADAADTAVVRETIHKELVCIAAEAEAVVCIAFADLGPFGRELEREGKDKVRWIWRGFRREKD